MELHTIEGDHRSIIGGDVATTAAKISDCLAPKTRRSAERAQPDVQPLPGKVLPAGI